MEIRSLLSITLVLLGLGFVTTFISTFLAVFLIKGIADGIIILIILLVLAGLCLFLAFFHNDNPKSRTVYIIAASTAIFAGIVAISVPKNFHLIGHYLNRTVVYFIIVAGIELAVCVFWPYLTNLFAASVLESASIDKVNEAILYITSNLITSFIAALLVCVSTSSIGRRISISVAAWFIGGIISACIGLIIAMKGGASSGADGQKEPINTTTEYDKIG